MSQAQAPRREVAQRAFAAEINDATYSFRESDDDQAPVYVLLPTGEKANRVFVVGTLVETNDVSDDADDEYWQARITDTEQAIFAYAGQYQPEVAAKLRELEPPEYVAVVGKPRTYETDDGDVNVSIQPEHLTVVDETTRDCWMTETAAQTLDRIERFESDEPNEYANMAEEKYDAGIEKYHQAVIDAVEAIE